MDNKDINDNDKGRYIKWHYETFISVLCMIIAIIMSMIPQDRISQQAIMKYIPCFTSYSFGLVLAVSNVTKGCLGNQIIASLTVLMLILLLPFILINLIVPA